MAGRKHRGALPCGPSRLRLSLVERTQARAHEPHAHEVRAELVHLSGDAAAREPEPTFREAHRLFVAIGAPAHAER